MPVRQPLMQAGGERMFARLDRAMNAAASGLALVGALAILAMLVNVTAYVVMRLVLSSPVPATVEIVSRYYMVLIAFLPLAWAERRGDMITITIFENLLPPPGRRVVAVFVALVTVAAYALLTWTTWLVAMREFAAGSFVISLNVALPTWPGYFALPAGFGLAAIVSAYRAVTLLAPPRDRPEHAP